MISALTQPLEIATGYLAVGLSVIPIRGDGTKSPAVGWKDYQKELATEEILRGWFIADNVGIAIVHGKVSGNSEVVDIDNADIFKPYCEEVERLVPGLIARLTIIKTPRPGFHLVYRCSEIGGSQKLAYSANGKVLVETKGQGGYTLAPGSPGECHETGRTYDHYSGPQLEEVPTITPGERKALFQAAAVFDDRPIEESNTAPSQAKRGHGQTPGDDFNQRADWADILTPHGWVKNHVSGDRVLWRRPGKDSGWSATTGCKSDGGNELFCCFSSNASPFEGATGHDPCSKYNKFAAYTFLNHAGDFSAAARELAVEGFGEKKADDSLIGSNETAITGAWPDPQPFECEKLPSFPVGALPDPLGEWSNAIAEATQTPVDLAAMQGLSVCSAAIAGKIDCKVRDGYSEPVNLYTATMMPPANRKSSVHSAATEPLRDYEQQLIDQKKADVAIVASERRVQEKKLANLEKQAASDSDKSIAAKASLRDIAIWLEENPTPALPQILTDDATVEALAMVMQQQGGAIASFSSEGGCFDIMAGRYNAQSNFDLFLKAHSGDRFRQTRISRSPIEIERPTLTCCYTLQPYHFEQLAAQKDMRGRGLMGRFLYSFPTSFVGERLASAKAVSESLKERYHNAVSQLCHLQSGTFKFNEEADARIQGWFYELEPRLGPDGDLHYIGDWGGKLVGATARIATILQAVKQGNAWEPSGTVEASTVGEAVEIANYLIPHAEHAFGLLNGLGNHETAAQELLRRIRCWVANDPTRTQFSRRDLQQKVRRQFASIDDLDGPLNELVERGWLRRDEESTKRRSQAFYIHPNLKE